MTDYIYNQSGSAVGFIGGRYVHEQGNAVGQLDGSHVHKLTGQYVGELEKDMIFDKGMGNRGNIGNPGTPGNPGMPGNPRNRGNRGYTGSEEISHRLLG
jgi:hypothetical protein